MDSYFVLSGADAPLLYFDTTRHEFYICGISHPESAMEFYGFLIRWLKCYVDKQLEKGECAPHRLTFLFRHINSMSFRSVSRVCRIFAQLGAVASCEIVWLFENEDLDIYEAGEDLKEELALKNPPFRLSETNETIESLQERLIHLHATERQSV
ncbi:MAG: SiaC family regulatory phosphoprotein [Bacteroides sp.]